MIVTTLGALTSKAELHESLQKTVRCGIVVCVPTRASFCLNICTHAHAHAHASDVYYSSNCAHIEQLKS